MVEGRLRYTLTLSCERVRVTLLHYYRSWVILLYILIDKWPEVSVSPWLGSSTRFWRELQGVREVFSMFSSRTLVNLSYCGGIYSQSDRGTGGITNESPEYLFRGTLSPSLIRTPVTVPEGWIVPTNRITVNTICRHMRSSLGRSHYRLDSGLYHGNWSLLLGR